MLMKPNSALGKWWIMRPTHLIFKKEKNNTLKERKENYYTEKLQSMECTSMIQSSL